MKKILILLLVTSTVLGACKKDDPEPTRTELISKNWSPSEVYVDGDRVEEEEEEFWKSITFEIRSDKTYTFKTPFGDETGVWAFNSDETRIDLDGDEGFTITELNSARLKTTHYEDDEKWDITWVPVN